MKRRNTGEKGRRIQKNRKCDEIKTGEKQEEKHESEQEESDEKKQEE